MVSTELDKLTAKWMAEECTNASVNIRQKYIFTEALPCDDAFVITGDFYYAMYPGRKLMREFKRVIKRRKRR
jgi:hypothetical protein